MPEIFLLSAKPDHDLLLALRFLIATNNMEVWSLDSTFSQINVVNVDTSNGYYWVTNQPEGNIRELRTKAIKESKCLVVLLSPHAKADAELLGDISVAVQANKPLALLLISGTQQTSVPSIVYRAQYIDARGDLNEISSKVEEQLIPNLCRILGKDETLSHQSVEQFAAAVEAREKTKRELAQNPPPTKKGIFSFLRTKK